MYTQNQVDKGIESSYENKPADIIGWDEISQSFVGNNIYVNAGRIDYNFDNLTLEYSTNARYPNEFAGSVKQLPHKRKNNSEIRPDIHWMQNSNNNPNILVAYRYGNNGEVLSNWILKALTPADNKFALTVAGMQQITEFNIPASVGEALGLSATFECKIYRDAQNASGLFTAPDSYSGIFEAKYYDIHFQVDQDRGSLEEFKKVPTT